MFSIGKGSKNRVAGSAKRLTEYATDIWRSCAIAANLFNRPKHRLVKLDIERVED